jgi:hypothetical protein
MKRNRRNKRGNWFVENLGQIVLTAIGIGIGIYFLWAYVLHGAGSSVNALQQCGSITGNKGECKESCDKSIELELPNVGCKGASNKCCVLKDDNMNDVILPTGYGGDDKYNFGILNIGIKDGEQGITAAGCKPDNKALTIIKCRAGQGVTIPVYININQIGKETVVVRADPVVVINDNGDSVKEHKYVGTTAANLAKDPVQLLTEIVVASTDAKPNTYWEIYPYATCVSQGCKDSDKSQSRGIYKKDPTNSNVLTIKFVNEI